MTAPPLIVSILHRLMRYARTREAMFVSRENRFVATVLMDGEEVRVHVKNTGRCGEILLPGTRVVLFLAAKDR